MDTDSILLAWTDGVIESRSRNMAAAFSSGGYRIAKLYMMQCYSSKGEFENKWRGIAVLFYGYKGVNALGFDMANPYYPWNW